MEDSILKHYKDAGRLGEQVTLPQLKDIFVKEDPYQLNEKMNEVQSEKMDVLKVLIELGAILSKNRGIVHSFLRRNYNQAITESKKSAGMEALETWAGAQNEEVGLALDLMRKYEISYKTMDKIRESLESDLSVLQSRAKIFSEVR